MTAARPLHAAPDPDDAPRPRRLLTVDQLADLLEGDRRLVHRLRAAGHLPPAIKLGNRLRWDAADIDAWLDSQKEN